MPASQSYTCIHTSYIYEIQIKIRALSTLIDAWCQPKDEPMPRRDWCLKPMPRRDRSRRKKKMMSLQLCYQGYEKKN